MSEKIRKIRVPRVQPNDEEWEIGQAIAASTKGRIMDILDQLPDRLWEKDYIEELLDIEEATGRVHCECVGATRSLDDTERRLVCNRCGAIVDNDYWNSKGSNNG